MIDELTNETNSSDVLLQGYISNTDLPIFDFDNTSNVAFNSLSAFRSAIYSSAIEIATKGIKNSTNIRIAGASRVDFSLPILQYSFQIHI